MSAMPGWISRREVRHGYARFRDAQTRARLEPILRRSWMCGRKQHQNQWQRDDDPSSGSANQVPISRR